MLQDYVHARVLIIVVMSGVMVKTDTTMIYMC